MSSGLERTPPIFGRPIWKDTFLWILLATAAFWAGVFWLAL